MIDVLLVLIIVLVVITRSHRLNCEPSFPSRHRSDRNRAVSTWWSR